ncbi:hypothetical protein ACH5RR_035994 [Cinchona calisaya]|uniref:F-box domain-containing protein n=1 Tax=Cinchona calisaya TaxID=153742 RepID=A0ABD2Y415_9GENT
MCILQTCISALWNQLAVYLIRPLTPRINTLIPPLPDDILVGILSILPAKSVLVCRCVCRSWKALTSTPEFLELHLKKNRVPKVIVQQRRICDSKKEISFVDCWGATERTSTCKLSVDSGSQVLEFFYACNGLLIFLEDYKLQHYCLVNPTTYQKVRLFTPEGSIYGVFFHPFVKAQYCVLWGGLFLRKDGRLRIRILDLDWSKSQSHEETLNWRELSYDDDAASVSYEPKFQSPPVTVDGVLYWMVGHRFATSRLESSPPCARLPDSCEESIMSFNTKTEKFSSMPHPGAPQDQLCKWDREHTRMHLMNKDDHGLLCICNISNTFNIWVLNENKLPLWIKWHTVDIYTYVSHYPFHESTYSVRRPVGIMDGELLLDCKGRGLFALDLNHGRVKRFERRIKNEDDEHIYFHIPSLIPIT